MRGEALVTGASSGIGAAFAESLAARGHPLLLVARRAGRLRALADRLRAAHGVPARVEVADLATDAGLTACRSAMDRADHPLEVMVLNAGFGSLGALAELPREREVAQVRLNCAAVVDLARHGLPGLLARRRGDVVIVSSAAAWQPVPYMAVYAATKAFELHLAEALAREVRGSGVRVVAVCPGPTRTEFSAAAGVDRPHRAIPHERPEAVVAAAWRGLERGRPRVAAGPIARLTAAASRTLPRRVVVGAAEILHRPRSGIAPRLKGLDGGP